MKKVTFLVVALLLGSAAWGQAVFNKFGPAAGIQKNTGTTYQNTAATAADLAALIVSGTPTAGHCAQFASATTLSDAGAACGGGGGGGVTSVALTAPSEFSVSGSPVTTTGTLAVTRVAGASTIAFATAPSTVNITTEGTLDWLLVGTGTVPDQGTNFANSGGGRKLAGGLQISGFGPAGATVLSTGGTWGTPSWTASANDSRTSGSSFSAYTQTLSFVAGGNNVGEIFRIPCDPFQRVARVYTSNATAYHIVLVSSDGSLNVDSGSHTPSTNEKVTITYTCTFPGQTVSVAVTDTASTTGNISIGGVTLGTT